MCGSNLTWALGVLAGAGWFWMLVMYSEAMKRQRRIDRLEGRRP